MTQEEIVLVPSSEPLGEQVYVWRPWSLIRNVLACFVPTLRDETPLERSRRLRIAALEDAVNSLAHDLDLARKEKSVLTSQIAGAAKCIAFHESRWEAMTRIQSMKGYPKQ